MRCTKSQKDKKNFWRYVGLLLLGNVGGKTAHAGGGGEGGTEGAQVGFLAGQYNTTYSSYNPTTGTTNEYTVSYNFDVDSLTTWSSGASTPFLLTWNGEKYVHENDFLFGKPNTAFANYKLGLEKYKKGIGGDTYILNNELKADEKGELKLQIRELEPEESYIDKFELNALDLNKNEHFIADGNLEDSYVFNIEGSKVLSGEMHHYHSKQNTFTKTSSAYNQLVQKEGESLFLHAEDELVMRIPKDSLKSNEDTFILVDSHYRDWSLGNQVPFSSLEYFSIQSLALGRSTVTTLTGIAILASGLAFGASTVDNNALQKLIKVPYTYADTPGTYDPCGCNNVMSGADHEACTACSNNSGSNNSRSLVISAGDLHTQTYLQTLFPRYVQASQEVVRIPHKIIKDLKESFLVVRIKATKKHMVKAAFVFQGEAKRPQLTPLSITKAFHKDEEKDYAGQLKSKDSNLLHTIPGNVVELSIKDAPLQPNTTRRYVLKANGFYTRMSLKTHWKVGKDWLKRLAVEDRKLLRRLRLG